MIRVLGYSLSLNKPIYIALTVIYGIGLSKAKFILKKLDIDTNIKVSKLSETKLREINNYLETSNLKLEGDLKKFNYKNIKNLIDINSYRGKRHLKGLPCRGQRTRTNSRVTRYKFKHQKVISL